MNKILVIGESLSKRFSHSRPWQKGNSSKRLWRWFDCDNYNQFVKLVKPINAIINGMNKEYLRSRLLRYIYYHEVVVFVGKKSQDIIFDDNLTVDQLSTVQGKKIIFVPHPSGLNVSCNYRDEEIIEKIKEVSRCRSKIS